MYIYKQFKFSNFTFFQARSLEKLMHNNDATFIRRKSGLQNDIISFRNKNEVNSVMMQMTLLYTKFIQ